MPLRTDSGQEDSLFHKDPMYIESLGFKATRENVLVSIPEHNIARGVVDALEGEQCSCRIGVVRIFGEVPHTYAVVKCKNFRARNQEDRCYSEWR